MFDFDDESMIDDLEYQAEACEDNLEEPDDESYEEVDDVSEI